MIRARIGQHFRVPLDGKGKGLPVGKLDRLDHTVFSPGGSHETVSQLIHSLMMEGIDLDGVFVQQLMEERPGGQADFMAHFGSRHV